MTSSRKTILCLKQRTFYSRARSWKFTVAHFLYVVASSSVSSALICDICGRPRGPWPVAGSPVAEFVA